MVVHETAHKTAFRSRALNLVFGHLSSFAVIFCLTNIIACSTGIITATRRIRLQGSRAAVGPDPALRHRARVLLYRPSAGRFRVGLLLRHALTGNATSPWIPESKRHVVVREARLYVALYVVLLLASLALHTPILLWVWIVPAARRPVVPASLSLCRAHRLRPHPQRLLRIPAPPIPLCSSNGLPGTCPIMSSTMLTLRFRSTRCRS